MQVASLTPAVRGDGCSIAQKGFELHWISGGLERRRVSASLVARTTLGCVYLLRIAQRDENVDHMP